MYLDVYHLSRHPTIEFTFMRWLQVGEDEFVYGNKAKFEVVTPHGATKHLQYRGETVKSLN